MSDSAGSGDSGSRAKSRLLDLYGTRITFQCIRSSVPLIVFEFEREQNDIFSHGVLARFIQLLCHAFRYSV
jgi:hypothetical protein